MLFFVIMKTITLKKNLKNVYANLGLFLLGVLLVLLSLVCPSSWAEETKRLAILPLSIHAPERMDYLREGIEDMLSSRLTWEEKVLVLNRSQVQKGLEKISGPIDETLAVQTGKKLGAQAVLWGSINIIGSNISLDLSVLDIAQKQPVKKFFGQAKGMDEVILRVNEISAQINEKVFGRPRPTGASPAPVDIPQPKGPEPPQATTAPGKTPLSLKGFIINPLSPQIIMNAGGFGLTGVWRSAVLPFALVDLAFGDLEGDGKIETVLISKNSIYICRFIQDQFQIIKEIPGDRWDNYVAVDVGDIHQTGRPQIFVTNYRSDGLKSKILSWDRDEYRTIAQNIPYHLRIHRLPGRGIVLLGQQKMIDNAFGPGISILSWKDGQYIPVEKLKLPDEFTVFNFTFLDSKKSSPEYLFLSSDNRLLVLNDKGKAEYSSGDSFGGSLNLVIGKEVDTYSGTIMDDVKSRIYIPARLLVTSVFSPGTKEIIINKNKGSYANILSRYRSYSSGEILSLSWDGASLKENWRTQTISDYIANYGVADFKNNGQQQLVVGVVQSSGLPLISNARSVLYCYDLGVVKPGQK
ncbi:MAG: hypothetical protein HY879_22750 [Deltaproteobacteria bacterium]|nr:hypothetical protein [Deltaproteobacteria bacterium]